MFRPTVVASALALSGLANAFYDSVPFIAWSNRPHNIVGSLHQHNPAVPSHAQVINSVLSNDDLCQLDAVVVIGQPGLHANQLNLVQYESSFRNYLTEMPSKSYFPYVPVSSVVETNSVAQDVAALCGSTVDEWTSGQTYETDAKRVLYFDLPETVGRYWEEEGLLHENLSEISSQFGSYAVLLTGTSNTTPALVTKRQQANSLSHPNFSTKPAGIVATFANDTLPTGGILARYQLLTPGLLTSLLVAFGILIPLLMVGINALASIQSPLRTEAPKGPSLEKKNQ